MKNKPSRKKPGPDPEILRAEGADWDEAVAHVLKKTKPAGGWDKTSDCKHENLHKEVAVEQEAGDLVCQECGAVLTPDEVADLRKLG